VPRKGSDTPDVTRLGALGELTPAHFAMVMATGIVSLTAQLFGMPSVSRGLFVLNVLLYGALCALTGLRLALEPRPFLAGITDHARGPVFFTAVAGTSVLASQFVVLSGDYRIAGALGLLALALWIVLTYAIFAGLTIAPSKPPLDEGIGGGWLLAVVATQSIAVVGALLAPQAGSASIALDFLALAMWLAAGMLYIWIMALIFYRYTFFPFAPADLTPPYWINMGAMAISTLAGALLIRNAAHTAFLASLEPFLKGFTVFYWASGSWWIPLLAVLAFWRYVWRRFPLKYDPLYWGAVFPLGMYAAATEEMIDTMHLEFLEWLAHLFAYLALAAWVIAFAGFALDLVRRSRSPVHPEESR
jgi:tellurite resistance protein TehA-like permease